MTLATRLCARIALFSGCDKTKTASGREAEENELARCLGTEFKTSIITYEND
jgi:hypothetical protein